MSLEIAAEVARRHHVARGAGAFDALTSSEVLTSVKWSAGFRSFKRAFDVVFSIAALPSIIGVSIVLLVLNPFYNPGPLFFRQDRMGRGGRRFRIWKFRTMRPERSNDFVRPPDAPIDDDRITLLGRILRNTRLDELPNVFNILLGDMSLVGPRPDAWRHARHYITLYPEYSERLRVKPGVTGLAQIRDGYADTLRAVERKARYDRFYIRHGCALLDFRILLGTCAVVVFGNGAK